MLTVKTLYQKFFPSQKYKTDKAMRRFLQLPVVIFQCNGSRGNSPLFITDYKGQTDYKRLMFWISKLDLLDTMRQGQQPAAINLDKSTLSALCKLASSDKDRALLKYTACQASGLSSTQARKIYGITDHKAISEKVKVAMKEAEEIREAVLELAKIEELAVLKSLRLTPEDQSVVPNNESEDDDEDAEECTIEWRYPSDEDDEDAMNTEVSSDRSIDDLLPERSYNPDNVDKQTLIANPAPANDVLLSWLRERNLNWFLFYEDVNQYLRAYSSEVLHQVLLDFTDYLPQSDLTEQEEKLVELSRQAFLEVQRRKNINNEEDIESDSDNDQDTDSAHCGIDKDELLRKVNTEKVRIRRRMQRKANKEIAENCILKRKCPPAVSKILKKYPNIGKDMEAFVESKRVGADAW